jgi:glycerophosphoryl diester phosphodiesterase
MMSFSPLAVRRMHQLAPRVPLVFLTEYRMPITVIESSVPPGTAIGPYVELLREHPRYIERLQARGRQLHVWTADTRDEVSLCVQAGVDVIITNRPAEVLRQLDEVPALAG